MSCRRQRLRLGLPVVAACLMMVLGSSRALFAACVGDCNHDGAVTVAELLQGVNIALGAASATACAALDANGDGEVSINELLAAVNAALNGCPLNHAPDVPCFGIYEGSSGYQIQLPIDAADTDNDHLLYTSASLPDGAQLDAQTGIFSWTPTLQQFGTFYVPFTVTDDGAPPQSTDGLLTFKVSPQDLCQAVTCDPATGCDSTPVPLSQPCCTDQLPRVAEPVVPCPEGRALFVGRNTISGIGRLQDCDILPVVTSAQTSATVRLNLQVRCVNAASVVTVHARLVTQDRLVFDSGLPVLLDPGDNGYLQRIPLPFQVQTPGPFFDLDGADGDLTVTLTDADGVSVSTHVRPTLTFARPTDLTDLDAPPPAGQVTCP